MVDTPGTQPALDDLEAASFTQYHVGSRDADVVEEDVPVAVRCVVVPEHGQHAVDSDPWRRGWHEDDRLALVHLWVIRGSLAHDHVDLTTQVACAGGPPFLKREGEGPRPC